MANPPRIIVRDRDGCVLAEIEATPDVVSLARLMVLGNVKRYQSLPGVARFIFDVEQPHKDVDLSYQIEVPAVLRGPEQLPFLPPGDLGRRIRAPRRGLCPTCPAGRPLPGETRCPRCREERRAFLATEAAYRAGGMEIDASEPYAEVRPWLR